MTSTCNQLSEVFLATAFLDTTACYVSYVYCTDSISAAVHCCVQLHTFSQGGGGGGRYSAVLLKLSLPSTKKVKKSYCGVILTLSTGEKSGMSEVALT